MRFYEAIHGVYFDDLDALQILHNSRYLLLFERTIGSFWMRFVKFVFKFLTTLVE